MERNIKDEKRDKVKEVEEKKVKNELKEGM
jgi:hypothetical protein